MKTTMSLLPVKNSVYSHHLFPSFMNYNHLLLFIILSTGLDIAHAREWFVTPEASSRLIFDSNYRLRSNTDIPDLRTADPNDTRTIKPKDTIGGRLSAGGTIGSETENSDIHIRGNVAFNRFNIDNFNSIDGFLYPEARFTVSPRDTLGISGTLFFDTTLAREVSGNTLNTPQVDSSTNQNNSDTDDLLGQPKRRFRKSIKPEWTHALTEKTSLNLSYEFTDVTYQDSFKQGRLNNFGRLDTSGRSNYSVHSGQLNLSHQLTSNTLIFSNIAASLFSTPDRESSTTYYSLQAGVQHKFSERWEAEVIAGGRYSISESTTQSQPFRNADGSPSPIIFDNKNNSSGFGSLASASITHHYTKGRLRARIGQDIRPTGNGDLQTSNELALTWIHDLSEHLNLSLPISALRAAAINSDTNRLDRIYYQAAPTLSWRLTPEFSLALTYRYRYQKYDDIGESANSHNAMLSANYRWKRLSVSR